MHPLTFKLLYFTKYILINEIMLYNEIYGGEMMKKTIKPIIYILYIIVVLLYIYLFDSLYQEKIQSYAVEGLKPYEIAVFGSFIFGALLGSISFINELLKKRSRWKYNLMQALIIGLPSFLLGISIVVYYATDILMPRFLYDNQILNQLAMIVSGFIIVASIKRKGNGFY